MTGGEANGEGAAGAAVVQAVRSRFVQYRTLADAALAQAPEAAWTQPLGGSRSSEGEMTLATQMRHVGGNLQSRFTDLLTSDGEKPWRHRDREFDPAPPADARATWETGWTTLVAALDGLTDADLARAVTIRGEGLSVLDALLRALAHVAYHVGQIVLLAKHHAGQAWTPLTIPRGQSETYHARPFDGPAARG